MTIIRATVPHLTKHGQKTGVNMDEPDLQLASSQGLDELKKRLRQGLKDSHAIYERAKAFLEDRELVEMARESSLSLVRKYSVGMTGETCIGLIASARQQLGFVDAALEIVNRYESDLERLAKMEERDESTAAGAS